MEMSARLAEVVATATASVFAHIPSFSKKIFFEPSAKALHHTGRTGARFQRNRFFVALRFSPFGGMCV
jgi:hypothetical protein